jgi:hypothetical protein
MVNPLGGGITKINGRKMKPNLAWEWCPAPPWGFTLHIKEFFCKEVFPYE